jgi:hypothetical protein
MARALSTAATRASGGDLGQVSPADMNPALARIVAALPPGGVSEPMLTEKGGFRVVRVVAKEEATVTPFEEVKDELTKRLGQERMASAYEQYVEGLRKASEKTTRTTVSEVSLQVPNLPASTLSGPGLGPAPGGPESDPGAAPAPSVRAPALPGIDASEISTTPQARPERVAPPALPGHEGEAAPSPAPSPSPSPGA